MGRSLWHSFYAHGIHHKYWINKLFWQKTPEEVREGLNKLRNFSLIFSFPDFLTVDLDLDLTMFVDEITKTENSATFFPEWSEAMRAQAPWQLSSQDTPLCFTSTLRARMFVMEPPCPPYILHTEDQDTFSPTLTSTLRSGTSEIITQNLSPAIFWPQRAGQNWEHSLYSRQR